MTNRSKITATQFAREQLATIVQSFRKLGTRRTDRKISNKISPFTILSISVAVICKVIFVKSTIT